MDEKIYNRLLFHFVNSIIEAYKKLSGVTLSKPQIESTSAETFSFDGCVAMTSFKGGLSGRVGVALDEPIALKVSQGLTLEEQKKIDKNVLFSASEFLNIVGGIAFSSFNNEFREKRILPAPPSAFYGKGLRFVNFKVKGFNVLFSEPDGALRLNIVVLEERNG